MKTVFGWIGGVVAILGLVWLFQGNDFFMYKVFAPRQEAVRRQVFVQSQAYNDGMAQQLADIQRQYVTADSAGKLTLLSIVYHRYASYDETLLPQDLRTFLSKVRMYETSTNGELP